MNRNSILFNLILILTGFISAQASAFGDIKGSVLDPQQHAIAGAKVTLTSRSSSFSRTTDSDGIGEFAFRSVPIGEYSVTAESNGFAKFVVEVTVLSDRTTVLRAQLKIAGLSQQVIVNASPRTVDANAPTPVRLPERVAPTAWR
jgi:hypothetical protein